MNCRCQSIRCSLRQPRLCVHRVSQWYASFFRLQGFHSETANFVEERPRSSSSETSALAGSQVPTRKEPNEDPKKVPQSCSDSDKVFGWTREELNSILGDVQAVTVPTFNQLY
jgi:hypothetical protein